MKWHNLIADSQELLQTAVEKAAESPKTTVLVSAYSFLAGFSAMADWFSSALPKMAIFAGFIGALILAYLNWKKTKLIDIEAEGARLKNRMIREEMRRLKIEIRDEDDLT